MSQKKNVVVESVITVFYLYTRSAKESRIDVNTNVAVNFLGERDFTWLRHMIYAIIELKVTSISLSHISLSRNRLVGFIKPFRRFAFNQNHGKLILILQGVYIRT